MDKLLIIDGSNLLFQMFFGMPSRIINKDGKAIHGTLGFIGALKKIIKMTNPTHLIVLFDGERGSNRSDINAEYKANRPDYSLVEENENPFSQLQDIYNALDFLKICHTETNGIETDDLIAGYCRTFGDQMEIIVSSFDSDFFQLITDNVKIFRYRGDNSTLCDSDYIKTKYQITPSQYADFKSLTGDTADNIKGACKVGPKTASALINQFGTLENLLNNYQQIEKPTIRNSIESCLQTLANNYKIIKLSNDCNLPFDLTMLKYSIPDISTKEILKSIGL